MTDPMTAAATPTIESAATPLRPVFLGLRISLHLLVTALVAFVILRQILTPLPHASWIIALAIILFVSYVGGAFLTRSQVGPAARVVWLALVSLEGVALVYLTPDAAFLIFPLFFLQLHLLRARWAVPAIAVSTAITVTALAMHGGWSVGGVIGPVIGATVAVVIGLGYRALYRETRQRQQLIDELLATRELLAAREREAGVMDERSRLAREIHDTVAQGLSSIQLLLHAAERSGMDGEALEQVTLARQTAASSLAETRNFIRELAPPALDGQSLVDAVSRLAASTSRDGLDVNFRVSGSPRHLDMPLETTLLRIAQASLSNVTQHASATHAELTLTYLEDWISLDIVDDGRGFSPADIDRPGSFGLVSLRERVEKLGGTLAIESQPGSGTAIAVAFEASPLDEETAKVKP
ncbi:MAG TPA: sensor histidine kinase [Terrimesophilobacter sp.]|nr:sensor histidine kinase [Terrimesophilobacter sp.]